MKYIITESQYNKIIDRFISSQFDGFEAKTTSEYPTSIFWVKNDEVIAEIEKSGYFVVKSKLWDIIAVMFSLDFDEVQSSIKNWLEEHHNLGNLAVEFMFNPFRRHRWAGITNWDK